MTRKGRSTDYPYLGNNNNNSYKNIFNVNKILSSVKANILFRNCIFLICNIKSKKETMFFYSHKKLRQMPCIPHPLL